MNTILALALTAAHTILPSKQVETENLDRIIWIKDALVTTFEGITKGVFTTNKNNLEIVANTDLDYFSSVTILDEPVDEDIFIDFDAEAFTLSFEHNELIEDATYLDLLNMEQLSLEWLADEREQATNKNIHDLVKEAFKPQVTSSMEFPSLPEFLQTQVIEIMDEGEVVGEVTGLEFLLLDKVDTPDLDKQVKSFLKKQGLILIPVENEGDSEISLFVPKKSKKQEDVYVTVSTDETVLIFSLHGTFEQK